MKPDSSLQGQAQELGIRILVYGLWTFLCTEDDSGLLTGPITFTKTLKHFFEMFSLNSSVFSLLLSTCFFFAEQEEPMLAHEIVSLYCQAQVQVQVQVQVWSMSGPDL